MNNTEVAPALHIGTLCTGRYIEQYSSALSQWPDIPCVVQGKISTTDRPEEPTSNGASISNQKAQEILAEMPAEQQKQLAQIYSFLTQVPCVALCLHFNMLCSRIQVVHGHAHLLWCTGILICCGLC